MRTVSFSSFSKNDLNIFKYIITDENCVLLQLCNIDHRQGVT